VRLAQNGWYKACGLSGQKNLMLFASNLNTDTTAKVTQQSILVTRTYDIYVFIY